MRVPAGPDQRHHIHATAADFVDKIAKDRETRYRRDALGRLSDRRPRGKDEPEKKENNYAARPTLCFGWAGKMEGAFAGAAWSHRGHLAEVQRDLSMIVWSPAEIRRLSSISPKESPKMF
jgi:hypothetical protein